MKNNLLQDKKVLITAGPTHEPIDHIGFISNHNGGKLGYEIASAMLQQGARVFLVSGPVKVDIDHPQLTVIKVNTACEMYMACCRFFEDIDIAVFAAAVSDFRPKVIHSQSFGSEETFTVKMVRNMDVAAAFANVKNRKQVTAGITAERDDNVEKAMAKMERKNFDMIVLNTVNTEPGKTNALGKVSIIRSDYSVQPLSPLKSKADKIHDIVEAVAFAWEEKAEAVTGFNTTANTVAIAC